MQDASVNHFLTQFHLPHQGTCPGHCKVLGCHRFESLSSRSRCCTWSNRTRWTRHPESHIEGCPQELRGPLGCSPPPPSCLRGRVHHRSMLGVRCSACSWSSDMLTCRLGCLCSNSMLPSCPKYHQLVDYWFSPATEERSINFVI